MSEYGLAKLNEDLYLIVKREAIKNQFDLPDETPFEVYGFISTENGFITIMTKTLEVLEVQDKLFALIINGEE